MKYNRIDTHQHFWKYDPTKQVWMNGDMEILKTDFLPEQLQPILQNSNLDGCISVQANQAEEDNIFLLDLAESYPFIRGIVGWVDLCAENIEQRLDYYQQFKKIKGFRHVLHDEKQRDFMLRPDFINGISKLKKYKYSYDVLIFTDQLGYTMDFIKTFPEQAFVIDHIAKPLIKQQILSEWKTFMKAITSFPEVYCKISGLVTEADWKNWKKEDFKIYLDVVIESFGVDRIMYGSDWPVCLLAATYEEQYNVVADYFSGFSEVEKSKIFGGNSISFYQL